MSDSHTLPASTGVANPRLPRLRGSPAVRCAAAGSHAERPSSPARPRHQHAARTRRRLSQTADVAGSGAAPGSASLRCAPRPEPTAPSPHDARRVCGVRAGGACRQPRAGRDHQRHQPAPVAPSRRAPDLTHYATADSLRRTTKLTCPAATPVAATTRSERHQTADVAGSGAAPGSASSRCAPRPEPACAFATRCQPSLRCAAGGACPTAMRHQRSPATPTHVTRAFAARPRAVRCAAAGSHAERHSSAAAGHR